MCRRSGSSKRAAGAAGALTAAVALPSAGAHCPIKTDLHGVWSGETNVGGNYTLKCNPGFSIIVGDANKTKDFEVRSISCQGGAEGEGWTEDPVCVNWDNCRSLKHNCGKFGVCVDGVRTYHCRCEEGVKLKPTTDGSGEYICGSSRTACAGHTCGSHGICIELEGDDQSEGGGNFDKCSCEKGYHDNGETCVPNDCGPLSDPDGVWQGVPKVGGEYTLICGTNAFVVGSVLRQKTIVCPVDGHWESGYERLPRCFNAFLDSMDAEFRTFRWWFALSCASMCIFGAALAAGLTMGLVSLSSFELKLLTTQRLQDCTTPQEAEQLRIDQSAAGKVQPLLKDHHRLLVTLLLLNSVANEALPIFLDQLMPAYMAVIISVTCVLFLGEILPSAIFTGPSQLSIAAMFAPVVICLQMAAYPLAVPIKQLLDYLVGHNEEGLKYTRAQLKALLRLHVEGCYVPRREATGGEFSRADEESDPDKSDTDGDLKDQRKRPLDDTTERLLRVEEVRGRQSRRPSVVKDDGVSERGLTHLECELAQRSLDLAGRDLRSVCLVLDPMESPEREGSSSAALLQINDSMSLAEAISRASRASAGQRLLVLGQHGSRGTTTREAILWAAFMPPGPNSEASPL